MSVSDGQEASATVFNSSFISRLTPSGTVAVLSLAEPGSGTTVSNTQQAINDNISGIASNVSAIGGLNTRITDVENSLPGLSTFDATSDPGSGTDSSLGYGVGSVIININNNRIFQAVDVTVGAAIWKRLDKTMLEIKGFAILDMSVNNVNDSAYTEIIADVGSFEVKRIQAFYPDGDPALIAVGAAAAEVDEYVLTAGGNVEVGLDVNIPANSRISIKLATGGTTNTSGKLVMNFLGES